MPEERAVENQKAPSAAEALGQFLATAPKSYDQEVIERARLSVIDTIGCILLGASSAEADAVFEAVRHWGQGDAAVIGRGESLAAPWAALVNGTAAHAYDYDDWDDPSLVHTSAVLLPAILAAMSEVGGTGEDLLDAHILGAEVMMRVGEALNPSHYWKGWHATSTLGAIGAAAAVCRLHKMDASQTTHALSIVTSLANGFVSQFGTQLKPAHAGLAAKAGLMAAAMAKSGLSASPLALDGPVSLLSTSSDATAADFEEAISKLGKPWAISEYGLHIKFYPSCGGTHRVIECARQIKEKAGIGLEDIAAVEISVPKYLDELLPYRFPTTKPEALFSFTYCAATALDCGDVGIDQFEESSIAAIRQSGILDRMTVTTRDIPYVDKLFVAGNEDVVTVTTRDGKSYNHEVSVPFGAPPRMADRAAVSAKYLTLAPRSLSERPAQEVLDLLCQAPAAWEARELMKTLDAARPLG